MAGFTTARINAIDRRSSITWLSLFQVVSSFSPFFFSKKCHLLDVVFCLRLLFWIERYGLQNIMYYQEKELLLWCVPPKLLSFSLSLCGCISSVYYGSRVGEELCSCASYPLWERERLTSSISAHVPANNLLAERNIHIQSSNQIMKLHFGSWANNLHRYYVTLTVSQNTYILHF